MKRVRVHSDAINQYGGRILTSGLDWSLFDANSIMLYNHIRTTDSWDKTKLVFPIGKWTDRQVGIGEVSMLPEFDEDDENGRTAKSKWEKDILNTASIHVRVIEWSEDPAYMLPGQTRPTITKALVMEVSITDLPGNHTCHKLSFDNGYSVALSGDGADTSELDKFLPVIKQKKSTKMDELQLVAQVMGLPEGSSAAAIVAASTNLKNENTRLAAELDAAQKERDALKLKGDTDKCVALVAGAVAAGKITKAQEPIWQKLAEGDYENTKVLLDTMKPYVPPTTQLSSTGTDKIEGDLVARYKELDKAGKLGSLPEEERNLLLAAYVEHLEKSGVVKATA